VTVEDEAKQNPLTVVKLLWCGQGQLGLVEIYNDGKVKAEADFLALINCGGEKQYAQASLDYVRDKVAARHRKLLNLVVFTRLDPESTSLLGELGKRLQPIGAQVMSAFVPGNGGLGRELEAVEDFFTLLGFSLDGVEFASADQSDYLKSAEPTWIAEHNGTYFRILTTDNRSSVRATVLVVDNARLGFILPGQLTFPIMQAIMRIPDLDARLPPDRVLLLPNHSVLESAAAARLESPPGTDQEQWEIIEKFAAAISPAGICVSAGVDNCSGIPAAAVLDVFAASLRESDERTYVCFGPLESGDIFGTWQTVTTKKAIRTTLRTFGSQEPTTYGWIHVGYTLRPELTGTERQAAP
jgi:hypothetical protein